MKSPASIGLVDDDPNMRKALKRLLSTLGFDVHLFSSAAEFLDRAHGLVLDCLILDISMPGLNGLDLHDQLNGSGQPVPVVFLSGQGDIPMSVRAIKAGAVNFLTKPVDDIALIAAIQQAIQRSTTQRAADQAVAQERARLLTLTPRELEVFRHVIAGKLNKQTAADLGTSEQTIKVHRMRITEKMGMPSVAELVRVAARLNIPPIP